MVNPLAYLDVFFTFIREFFYEWHKAVNLVVNSFPGGFFIVKRLGFRKSLDIGMQILTKFFGFILEKIIKMRAMFIYKS